jgi:hypothetical protein
MQSPFSLEASSYTYMHSEDLIRAPSCIQKYDFASLIQLQTIFVGCANDVPSSCSFRKKPGPVDVPYMYMEYQ